MVSQKKRLAESLDDKLVLQIPTALLPLTTRFSVIKFVQDEIQQFYAKKEEKKKACLRLQDQRKETDSGNRHYA